MAAVERGAGGHGRPSVAARRRRPDAARATRIASAPMARIARRRFARTTGVVALLGALAWALTGRGLVNYDTLYALVWGRDLAHGTLPGLRRLARPDPAPAGDAAGGVLLTPLSSASDHGVHGEAATDGRARRRVRRRSARSAGSSTALGARVVQPARPACWRRRSSSRAARCSTSARAPTSTSRTSRSCSARCSSRRAARARARRCSRCSPSPACCAPRRGCSRSPTSPGCGGRRASAHPLLVALAARRAGAVGARPTSRSPATRCTR